MIRFATVVCLVLFMTVPLRAQIRQMDQDPNLNNLVHAAGYETCQPGTLDAVEEVGTGKRTMILIAGAGFGGNVFKSMVEPRKDEFRMFLVTLPGFGGTAAPPMPEAGTSYAEQTWTNGAVDAVVELIQAEDLKRPTIVVHWYVATQVGLRLALDYPHLVGGVVVISGVPKSPFPATSLEESVKFIDSQLAPQWFKTVTRDTWDDNNFLPGDYARHPVRALQLWRQAANAPMPVWIRYLCESWAQDITLELDQIKVPTLVIKPGFDKDHWAPPGQNYLKTACVDNWDGDFAANESITLKRIDDARVFIMDDQPEELDKLLTDFLKSLE